jgi:hypothetical protein
MEFGHRNRQLLAYQFGHKPLHVGMCLNLQAHLGEEWAAKATFMVVDNDGDQEAQACIRTLAGRQDETPRS